MSDQISLFPPYPGPTMPPLPPPFIPTVKEEPLPKDQQDILNTAGGSSWVMNRLWHVAQMNQWYMNEIRQENAAKVQMYMAAYQAWAYNAQLYASCRPPQPIPAPPAPPALQDIVPLPASHWFA